MTHMQPKEDLPKDPSCTGESNVHTYQHSSALDVMRNRLQYAGTDRKSHAIRLKVVGEPLISENDYNVLLKEKRFTKHMEHVHNLINDGLIGLNISEGYKLLYSRQYVDVRFGEPSQIDFAEAVLKKICCAQHISRGNQFQSATTQNQSLHCDVTDEACLDFLKTNVRLVKSTSESRAIELLIKKNQFPYYIEDLDSLSDERSTQVMEYTEAYVLKALEMLGIDEPPALDFDMTRIKLVFANDVDFKTARDGLKLWVKSHVEARPEKASYVKDEALQRLQENYILITEESEGNLSLVPKTGRYISKEQCDADYQYFQSILEKGGFICKYMVDPVLNIIVAYLPEPEKMFPRANKLLSGIMDVQEHRGLAC